MKLNRFFALHFFTNDLYKVLLRIELAIAVVHGLHSVFDTGHFNSVCTDGHAESSLNGRFSMCRALDKREYLMIIWDIFS